MKKITYKTIAIAISLSMLILCQTCRKENDGMFIGLSTNAATLRNTSWQLVSLVEVSKTTTPEPEYCGEDSLCCFLTIGSECIATISIFGYTKKHNLKKKENYMLDAFLPIIPGNGDDLYTAIASRWVGVEKNGTNLKIYWLQVRENYYLNFKIIAK